MAAAMRELMRALEDGGDTEPHRANKLVGTLAQPLGAGARIVISATLADGQALQARFTNN
jgi:hypothetical protein